MELDYSEIGKNIRTERNRQKMKQAELAERIGVTSQHISHIECQKTKLSLSVLVAISNTLSVDINLLLGSNVEENEIPALEAELSYVLEGAMPSTLKLCIELCKDVMKFPL